MKGKMIMKLTKAILSLLMAVLVAVPALVMPEKVYAMPSAPASLSATAVSPSQVDLSWSEVTGATSYLLQRDSVDASFASATSISIAGGTANYSDTGLSASTTYYYRLFAIDGTGYSPPSPTASAATLGAPAAPAQPTGLTATPVGPTQIDLSWTAASGATGYRLERAPDDTFGSITSVNLSLVTSYGDTGLSDNTNYYYRLYATNGAGDSAPSATVNATTLSAAPQAPTGLTGTAVSPAQVDLSWTDPNPVGLETSVALDRDTNSSFPAPFTVALAPNTESYSDVTVNASTQYYYRVRAINGAGTGTSSWFSVTTPAGATIPADPTSLNATANSATQVSLSWIDPNTANETAIKLQRTTDSNFLTGITTITLAAYSTSYIDNGLSSGVTYYYRVIATNLIGDSGPSNVATVTTLSAPAALTNFTATAVSDTQVDLSWTDPNTANETDQQLERTIDSTFNTGITSFTLAAYSTNYSDATVNASTTYYYRVFAVNAAGNSPAATTGVTTPAAPSPASQPTGLSAVAAGPTQVNLTWTDPNTTGETYEILERTTDATWATGIVSTNLTAYSTSHVDTTVVASTTYYYRVTAVNAIGSSSPSISASVTTPASLTVPAACSNLTANAISYSQIDLAWTDPNTTNETSIELQRALNPGFTSSPVWITLAPYTTSYGDTSVSPATTYYYRVFAANLAGNSAQSNTVSATTPSAPPAQVSSLNATIIGPSQIDLTWSASSGATGYRLERAPDITFAAITAVNLTVTTYSDTTVSGNTSYSYRVYATNSAGEALPSTTVTVTTPPATTVPMQLTGLTATAMSPTEIDLAWTDPNTAGTETVVYLNRSVDNFTSIDVTFSLAAFTTSYIDTSVITNTTYYYHVVAGNLAGNSTPSATASATTPTTALLSPTGLTAVAVSDARVDLTWTDPNVANETNELLEITTDSTFSTGITSVNLTPYSVNYTDNTVTANTTYYYRVTAIGSVGNSPPSAVAMVTTPSASVPLPLTGLTLQSATASNVSLSWADPNPSGVETGIILQSASDINFSTILLNLVLPPNTTTYDDTSVIELNTYYYQVIATNSFGDSLPSNTLSVTTPASAPVAPVAASNLTATKFSDTRVDMAWIDNSTDESGFYIDSSENSTFPSAATITFTVGANITSYSDNTVAMTSLDHTYYYRIVAYNTGGNATASNTASVLFAAVVLTPPSAPTGLTATAVGTTQVHLAWTNTATNANTIVVERATASNFTTGYVSWIIGPTLTTHDDATVTTGVLYYYRVSGNNAANNSTNTLYSNVVSITLQASTGGTNGGTTGGTGGTGGGGSGGGIVIPTTVTLTGMTGTVTKDSLGFVQNAVTITTPEGDCSVMIPAGVQMLAANKDALGQIIHTHPATVPQAAQNTAIVNAHSLGPDGATFNPGITITLTYDPNALPAGTQENQLTIGFWNGTAWQTLVTQVNTSTHTVSAVVTHFTTFAVIAAVPAPATPSTPVSPTTPSQPTTPSVPTVPTAPTTPAAPTAPAIPTTPTTPTSEEPQTEVPAAGFNWAVTFAIVGAVVVIGAIIFVLLRRKKEVA